MSEMTEKSAFILFIITLTTIIHIKTGKCFDTVTSEKLLALNSGTALRNITNIDSIFKENKLFSQQTLEKLNSTATRKSWTSFLSNNSTNPTGSGIGKTMRSFLGNLKSLFSTTLVRKKRTTIESEGNFDVRSKRLWKGHSKEVDERRTAGSGEPLRRKSSIHRTSAEKNRSEDDFISKRTLTVPEENTERREKVPQRRLKMRSRNLLPLPVTDVARSVRVFERMKKILGEEEEESARRKYRQEMKSHVPGDERDNRREIYKCKAGTDGIMYYKRGRIVSSRGLTYSEDDGNVKSLLCKVETSDTYRPDSDTFIRKSVSGLNVITNHDNPFQFLDHEHEINEDTLEIGSQSLSVLDGTSEKNNSISSVNTEDRGAHSRSKASTKFLYENGERTAFETLTDVEGSSTFNSTGRQKPLVLTGTKEESSSIVQNLKHPTENNEDNDNIATVINYKKITDFDVAFRNLFNR